MRREKPRPMPSHHRSRRDDDGYPAPRMGASARIAIAGVILGVLALLVGIPALVVGSMAYHQAHNDERSSVGDMRWWSPVAAAVNASGDGAYAAVALGAALVTPGGDGTRNDAPACCDPVPRAMVDKDGVQRASLGICNNINADRLQFCVAAGLDSKILQYWIAVDAACIGLPRIAMTGCADVPDFPFTGTAAGVSTLCVQTPMADELTDGTVCASVVALINDGTTSRIAFASVGTRFCPDAGFEHTYLTYGVRSCDSTDGDNAGARHTTAWSVAAVTLLATLLWV